MADMIRYAVSCTSLYGVISLLVVAIVVISVAAMIYKAFCVLLRYIYKIVCARYSAMSKYNEVHTKLGAKDVSVETNLKR